MQPVLALELSTDGIRLHELSYDGVWRKISAASLHDPFLPKKMVAMKQAARASQGRFFKNQVWLPAEQIKGMEVKLTADDHIERQAEAEAIVRDHPDFSDGEYIVQFGEEDVNGNVKIAAINRAILQEANRFVSGYGFGTQGFTSRDRIDGFYQQPYFLISTPPKVKVNYAKVGFYSGIAATIAAIVAGGYWAFNNLEFAPDPSISIEATEERVLDIDEDPRAPIRPTQVSTNAEHRIPVSISDDEELGPLPEHDISVGIFEALIEQSPLSSAIDFADVPNTSGSQSTANIDLTVPEMQLRSFVDNLPAPETAGFPLVVSKAITIEDTAGPSTFEGGTPLYEYTVVLPKAANVFSPRLTDVLPSDDSTVVLAAQLRKYNDSLGLTQVRENNTALLQMAQTAALQRVPTIVINGRPAIVPTLRGGIEISDVPTPPVAPPQPTLTIAELQSLPPIVTEAFPSITPLLRDGREVTALPPDPERIEEPVPAQAESDGEPAVQFTTIVSGLTTEQLQRIPPQVFVGRPETLPKLRGGVEVGAVSVQPSELLEDIDGPDAGQVPELIEAARLRPLGRPDSVELIAIVASLSKQALPSTNAPLHRPAGFADKIEAMADAIAEQARVTPTFNDAPRSVEVPTSANVARTATIDNGINLNETSLIGVFGTSGDYRALLRQRGGRYKMLEVGEKIDGWTIVAISENEVRLKKGSKNKTLKLPAER